jgi:type IV pilus assembly protein PilV
VSASRRPPPPRRGPGPRAGFTLVEVLLAMMILSVGLLALAGLGVTASVGARAGTQQTIAAAVAQSRFDSLASLPCRDLATAGPTTGTALTRGVRERWVVRDGVNVKNFVDTLTFPGRTRPLVYLTVLPCRD